MGGEPRRADPTETWRAGRAVARLGRQLALALDEIGLTDSQYRVLAVLADGDAATSAVAGRMAVTRPSMTALVDGLEERGLVHRCQVESDRRRVDLRLTSAGRRALGAADDAVEQRLGELARHGDEPEALLDGLAAWADVLDRARRAGATRR